jgi:hypothetical protein
VCGQVLREYEALPLLFPQHLEEGYHARRVQTGGQEHSQSFPIRLFLVLPAVAKLAENPGAFQTINHRAAHVASQPRQEQARRGVSEHSARRMPQENVLEFVCQDARQLVRRLGLIEQPAEDDDVPAGCRERIDRRIVDHCNPERVTRISHRRKQGRSDLLDGLRAGWLGAALRLGG